MQLHPLNLIAKVIISLSINSMLFDIALALVNCKKISKNNLLEPNLDK